MVGSDTLTLGITALGDLGGADPVRRNGARPGDVVACVGRLGLSAAGLALLERGLDGPALCLSEHRRPSPPYTAGVEAARFGATAMLDISDGLVQDLGHVARASAVDIDLDSMSLHPDPELLEAVRVLGAGPDQEQEAARGLMLAGGEDHALAATFPPGVELPGHWYTVGRVEHVSEKDQEGTVGGATVDGDRSPRGGWSHFGRG